ncbi:MAG: hypothetical protein C0404_09620 [Verrucomicrobia bacterium]|nr:hypothetical protein [Verrucomicrobiota bacterium]
MGVWEVGSMGGGSGQWQAGGREERQKTSNIEHRTLNVERQKDHALADGTKHSGSRVPELQSEAGSGRANCAARQREPESLKVEDLLSLS